MHARSPNGNIPHMHKHNQIAECGMDSNTKAVKKTKGRNKHAESKGDIVARLYGEWMV